MRKTILLLFLFFSFSLYAQIAPYSLCDDNNDGIASFDLAILIPSALSISGLNTASATVTFHETQLDAQTGANPVTYSYMNITPFTQTIFIRVADNIPNVYLTTVNLIVEPVPMANPGQLSFCDLNELAIYDLNTASPQINSAPSSIITYYPTLADAQNNTNAIPTDNVYIPTINPGIEILGVRVTNANTGCFSITTLTLNTQNCNTTTCITPTNLTVSTVTNTSAVLNWTNGQSSSTLWEVLLLPLGVPAPLPTTPGGILASTTPFVITGLNPNTCYSYYVRSICGSLNNFSAWAGPYDFCTYYNCTNTGQCYDNLTLIAFLDTNNNGIRDTGETAFNNGNFVYDVNDSGTPLYGNSNSGQFYIFDNNPTNTYDLSFAINPAYTGYFSSSTTYNDIILLTGSGTNTYYFPIVPLQPLNDLKVQLHPYGPWPRPGFAYINAITYKNNGSQTVASGTISFTKSTVVSVTGVSQAGITSTPTGFDYTFTNLTPNEERTIYVTMQVPTIPTVTLGDLVTNTVTITPLVGDFIPADNSAELTQAIVGSYDPNDKSESHGGKIGLDTFTANDYLYYTIQFENTGTANAEFIRIEDTLDADLDETTFEMIKASHTVNMSREGHQLVWHFYDINLPPTVSQPTLSHGYVTFRIKPRTGYAVGDIIPNTAEIYFDYNPPIVTNTFNTEFFTSLGNADFGTTNFQLYPNPAKSTVQILQNGNDTVAQLAIYDVTGKLVKSIPNSPTSIDVSALAKGVYFVEITTESHSKQTKKLVIQ